MASVSPRVFAKSRAQPSPCPASGVYLHSICLGGPVTPGSGSWAPSSAARRTTGRVFQTVPLESRRPAAGPRPAPAVLPRRLPVAGPWADGEPRARRFPQAVLSGAPPAPPPPQLSRPPGTPLVLLPAWPSEVRDEARTRASVHAARRQDPARPARGRQVATGSSVPGLSLPPHSTSAPSGRRGLAARAAGALARGTDVTAPLVVSPPERPR